MPIINRSKIDSLEEEISKQKRQVLEWEKRYADKETEFARYKERENNRPEIKLQAEINMLKIEKVSTILRDTFYYNTDKIY